MLKFSLGNPDNLIRSAYNALRVFFSRFGALLYFVILAAGLWHFVEKWSDFNSASAHVLASENWLWLGVTWLLLKVVHESAHGMTCRHFGGETRETSVLLFIPLPYVDVTSSWRFGSK